MKRLLAWLLAAVVFYALGWHGMFAITLLATCGWLFLFMFEDDVRGRK